MTRRPRWWQWPTILSLDAPAVALAWQALAAGEARVAPSRPAALVLGISVWLAYVADRWIEGWRLQPDQVRTQRHGFYQRLRWPVAAAWAGGLLADVAIAGFHLSRRELLAGTALLPLVMAYLLSHQLMHRTNRWRLPKEACVALLLAGGIAVFPAARLPAGHAGRLIIPTGLFILLAFGNCGLISVWEQAVDRSHGQVSLARQFVRGERLARGAAWLALGGGLLVALVLPSARATGACAAGSGALLLWVDRRQPKMGWEAARVLADLVLLTPLLALAGLR
jgi:hypothetical protein